MLPQSLSGIEDAGSATDWLSDLEVTPPAPRTNSVVDSLQVDPWQFSGIYEFETADENCLRQKGFMNPNGAESPASRTPPKPQRRPHPDKDPNDSCPLRKGWLVVDAMAGDTPIYNLDHGSFVSHHLIGPKWDGRDHFQSVTPNGDTTGPTAGMFKIEGEVRPDGTLNFYLLRPNIGKTGRLAPEPGSSDKEWPRVWKTIAPIHAVKQLDVYCHLHIRAKDDCASWNKNWTEYLNEARKQTRRSLGID